MVLWSDTPPNNICLSSRVGVSSINITRQVKSQHPGVVHPNLPLKYNKIGIRSGSTWQRVSPKSFTDNETLPSTSNSYNNFLVFSAFCRVAFLMLACHLIQNFMYNTWDIKGTEILIQQSQTSFHHKKQNILLEDSIISTWNLLPWHPAKELDPLCIFFQMHFSYCPSDWTVNLFMLH